jgi:hypothetical protein
MKKTLLIILAAGTVAASCTKTDTMNGSLKQSLTTGVVAVNNAVSTISSSKSYAVINANAAAMKSEATYTDSVTLGSVAGIYEYQPDLMNFYDFFIPHKMFVKTGTSDHMIVNLPQKLVLHPRFLRDLNASDTNLVNDFKIDASEYYYYFNYTSLFSYKLKAGFKVDTTDLGNMDVESSASLAAQNSSSSYEFPSGYTVSTSVAVENDTLTKTFSLTKGTDVLIKETEIAAQRKPGHGNGRGLDQEFRHNERLYILTIGNVEVRAGRALDSIQVYLNGVLQQHAGVKIVDSTDTDGSICHKRDILLTFDDGTTQNLSTLIDPAKEALGTLVDALHSMNFAKNIVDYIAVGIDYHARHHH